MPDVLCSDSSQNKRESGVKTLQLGWKPSDKFENIEIYVLFYYSPRQRIYPLQDNILIDQSSFVDSKCVTKLYGTW